MTKRFFVSAVVWGFILWLIGYALGIVLFLIVPSSLIGWIITPIGIIMTLWVLFKKVRGETLSDYFFAGVIWVLIAVLGDYFLIVKLFNPADGYYKLDVYLYYILTLGLPLVVGWKKSA